jgi:chromosome segregation ATPase
MNAAGLIGAAGVAVTLVFNLVSQWRAARARAAEGAAQISVIMQKLEHIAEKLAELKADGKSAGEELLRTREEFVRTREEFLHAREAIACLSQRLVTAERAIKGAF